MFCPKCGKSEQSAESYCRQCGTFLPDLTKPVKRQTPQDHVKANKALSVMSGVTSLALAVLLYSFLFRDLEVPAIVNYIVAGLLIANFAWQVQAFWRSALLREQLPEPRGTGTNAELPAASEKPALTEPDLDDIVPASVTERTTRHLSDTKAKSS